MEYSTFRARGECQISSGRGWSSHRYHLVFSGWANRIIATDTAQGLGGHLVLPCGIYIVSVIACLVFS